MSNIKSTIEKFLPLWYYKNQTVKGYINLFTMEAAKINAQQKKEIWSVDEIMS